MDEVVDLVAVQPPRRGGQDEVPLTLDQVGRLDGLGHVAFGLILGDELEIMVPDVEDAGGGAVARPGLSSALPRRSGRRRGPGSRRSIRGSRGGRPPSCRPSSWPGSSGWASSPWAGAGRSDGRSPPAAAPPPSASGSSAIGSPCGRRGGCPICGRSCHRQGRGSGSPSRGRPAGQSPGSCLGWPRSWRRDRGRPRAAVPRNTSPRCP